MQITISKEDLYSLIKSAVREVLNETKNDFIFNNIPYASDEEMKNIESIYDIPNHNQEVVFSETIDL